MFFWQLLVFIESPEDQICFLINNKIIIMIIMMMIRMILVMIIMTMIMIMIMLNRPLPERGFQAFLVLSRNAPPHKHLLKRSQHSFPIVLLLNQFNQSPLRHCQPMSNENGYYKISHDLRDPGTDGAWNWPVFVLVWLVLMAETSKNYWF